MIEPIFITVHVDQLRKNPWNTNRVSPQNEAKIRNSLERNGMFKPIVVRQVMGEGGYEIIGGEHRWEQAIALGRKDVPICNCGYITTEQAKEIGIIDNARYGADDTLAFAELLKELGSIDDLQVYLPYGETDLNAIFTASNIALDDLEIDESLTRETDAEEERPAKPAKTHTVMRYKNSNADAERITALIAQTQKDQGFTTSDDLTNAGDALAFLLLGVKPEPKPVIMTDPEFEKILADALGETP